MNIFKISHVVLITLLFSTQLFSQAKIWEKQISKYDTLTIQSAASTSEGETYLTGNFKMGTVIGNRLFIAEGDNDGIIAKYDSDGNLLWVQQITGMGAAYGTSVSVDQYGNCYVAGNIWGTVKFGNVELRSQYIEYDIFIAKYDKNGNFLWAKKAGGNNSRIPQITTDYNGGCYVSGYSAYTDMESFGGTPVNGSYVARYDADGKFVWVKQIPSGPIASDPQGNWYMTGAFTGEVSFGNNTLSGSGATDIFVVKYNKEGDCLWAKKAGGSQADAGNSISIDQSGDCYVTGSYSQTAAFGNTQITGNGNSDVFISKYDMDGNFLWVRHFGGSDNDFGTSVSADKNGNCYINGNFSKTVEFGGIPVTSKGGLDAFTAKYDKDGNFLWVNCQGDLLNDDCKSITSDGSGNCYSLSTIVKDYYTVSTYLSKYSDAKLSILSPAGSEQWRIGTKKNISWTTNLDKVMIQLSTNGGVTWVDLTSAPVDGSLGSYSITVPNKPSASCKIRIYSPDYANAADTSGMFTITNSSVPAITITSPNGSEKWKTGTAYNITWTASSTGQTLSIEFTADGGNSWSLISDSVASGQAGFKWMAPPDTSAQCRIRIKDKSNPLVYDISDNFFKVLPAPRIIFPNKVTDTLRIASTNDITWSAPLVKNIDIFYSLDKGRNWTKVNHYYNELVDASLGKYKWYVPAVSNSDSCMLKIADTDDPSIFDETDSLFTIYNPIRIKYPKGGDTLQAGNFYDLSWTANGIKYVKIEYSVLGPADCYLKYAPNYCDTLLLKENVRSLPYDASIGLYTWIVPDNANPRTRIKIIDSQNPSVYAESDMFVISPMPSPDSLYALFTSNSIKLSWKDKSDYEEGFKIERKQGTGNYTQIAVAGMDETSYTDNTIDPNNVKSYSYRIKAYNQYASSQYVEISLNPTLVDNKKEMPHAYSLEQNYPNPFNPSTLISFSLPKESSIKLTVYNELGETVRELLNAERPAGNYKINFNALGLASGLYFYSLEANSIDGKDNFREIKKMLLIK